MLILTDLIYVCQSLHFAPFFGHPCQELTAWSHNRVNKYSFPKPQNRKEFLYFW